MKVTCTKALFIKLGEGNSWAKKCFEGDFVHLNYYEIPHELARNLPQNLEEVFTAAREYPLGATEGASRSNVNQICKFYESDEQVLWFTFHANRLWCVFPRGRLCQKLLMERSLIDSSSSASMWR